MISHEGFTHRSAAKGLLSLWLLSLASCTDFSNPFASAPDGDIDVPPLTANRNDTDIEAPDIFQLTEPGLWDGRPSLGGVWVAHPDTDTPERVIIRNEDNGQSVTGALFRRERDIPGPRLQVSSDAAEALGMLAGAPAELSVTALRPADSGDVTDRVGGDGEGPVAGSEEAGADRTTVLRNVRHFGGSDAYPVPDR